MDLQQARRALVLVASGLALGIGTAAAEEPAAQVTAVVGEAVRGDAGPLAQTSALSERGAVETGEDGRCSLLVDDDALVEVCANTALRLERGGRGHRIVRLDAGSIRLVAEPRPSEQRIEVHTPAAIATLLGTIVHVMVDPATGTTTVTSEHSRVHVRSADAAVRGAQNVDALERVTVRPGAAPQRPVRIAQERIGELDGCTVDFRRRALEDTLDDWQLDLLDRLADADAGDDPLGRRPGPGPDELPLGPPGDDPTRTEGTCTPIDCGEPPAPRGRQQGFQLQQG